MLKKLTILGFIFALSACGQSSDVKLSGGTDNTLSVKSETTEVAVFDVSTCVRTRIAAMITDGACMLDSIAYLVGIHTMLSLQEQRDLVLYPYTDEELTFLGL